MKIEVKREVEKEIYELGDAIAGIVVSIKEKAKEGLTAAEIATALTENIAKIINGFTGLEQLPAEVKEDVGAFVHGIGIPVGDIVGGLLKKDVA